MAKAGSEIFSEPAFHICGNCGVVIGMKRILVALSAWS